ncbi:phosphoinositide binding [Raphanus sativus]|nr:phosphoinositide binding [Raphanus sativus]
MSESRVVSQSGQQQPSMMDLLTGEKSQTPGSFESVSVQNTSPQNTLKQDILAHKRKALALKKEGKISEAKEALQQAKLLERRLEEGENPSPEKLGREALVSAMQPPVVREKENSPKPMSSRDRFKLQQESLSHKRQAMKLRREGKMEEAEAEFEIAKTLEAQLEDSASSKSEPVEDVAVEDFLDPQLLSALKAIGLDSSVTTSASKPDTAQAAVKPVKPSPAKESDGNQERSQLEERIKAEKIKAVTLKRSGSKLRH